VSAQPTKDEKATAVNATTEAVKADAPKAEEVTVAENKKTKPQKAAGKKTVAAEAPQAVATESAVETEQQATKADKKRPARSRKPKAESKPVDLTASGLQLVETKAEAIVVSAPVETEKPAKPRRAASWQKNKSAETPAEPLVMVETQNK